MNDVIPSFFGATRAAGELDDFNDAFGNDLLRIGEVKRIVYPESPESRTRRFVEYDVLVQHRANNTAVTKLYKSCLPINSLAGFADFSFQLYREDQPQPGATTDEDSRIVEKGFGSKVLLLCINGASSEPVIIGGIRDDASSDLGRKSKGVHLEQEFNGVSLKINDDGGFSVTYKGPTTPRGELDTKRGKEEQTGTTVQVAADGTFTVATRQNKQTVVIDHAKGTITVTGDKDLTLHAEKIHIGKNANEQAVLGNTLVDLLGQLIDAITKETHGTPTGPSGPPLNAFEFKAIKARLDTALSEFVTIKKSP
jgi:hypothetical protein